MKMNNLIAHDIPLVGKHLIEASAGTGKTYNITRIYLRLLLERRLSVEQILVMTFTKDATEELRGRIDIVLRDALNHWDSLIVNDEFFIEIAKKITNDSAKILLKQALLFLDEAAIYTIHGFCKRVLNQHAFESGVSFNAQMEANCQDLVIEACQDWYRVLAKQSPELFLTLAEFWPDPNNFLNQFNKSISHYCDLKVMSPESVEASFQQLSKSAYDDLENNEVTLVNALIDVKKGQDKQNRINELQQLKQWLQDVEHDIALANSTMPDAFIDGRRFSRSSSKAELIEIFATVNQVKAFHKTLKKQVNKAKAFAVVREGVYLIRQAVTDKKQKQDLLNFDDLIITLENKLSQEQNLSDPMVDESSRYKECGHFAQTLFNQYPVALVDEFQDTDPLQFSILKSIYYPQPEAALYMIGDPKQAIYGFRGGDIFAYLSARNDCDHQWLMDTNWRSSTEMVQGYNRLFYGNSLNKEAKAVFGYGINYAPVKPSPVAKAKQSEQSPVKALQFVHFSQSAEETPVKQNFRPVMASWCADEICRLLLNDSSLNAQDIAILVRDGSEAKAIKQALENKGLSSVFLSNRANLFHSKETKQLLALLKGLLYLENDRLYTAALACGFLGFIPDKLYQLQQNDHQWQALKYKLSALRDEWLYKGFIGFALKLMHEHFSISDIEQDRALTNLLHLFEILQTASQRHRQPQALLCWFEQQCTLDNPEAEAELRLESDDNLLRIVTQHGSKGLEYPVVFIPFATRHKDPLKFGNKAVSFIEYHDEQGQLSVSLDGSPEAKTLMADEAYAEAIRLLYVAITRAEQRCYILTTEFEQYYDSPLGRTLKWRKDQAIIDSLQGLANEQPHAIGLLEIADFECEETRYQQATTTSVAETPVFSSKIERDWWLSSFSALSKNIRHEGVSIPDRDNDTVLLAEFSEQPVKSTLLRFQIAKGAHTGNLLHDILEHSHFNEPDWHQAMKWPLVKYGNLPTGYSELDLQVWLQQALNAQLPHGGSLADITFEKSLRESEFYFPMNVASSEQLAQLLTAHRQEPTTTALEQVNKGVVRLPAYKTLKGMMHGFIDLIFEHNNKYYVCDYKSSHLGDSFDAYSVENIKINIEKNHYDLQYLIYSLALHRHLSFSLPDYDPTIHFGGIYYFYLRGMTDAEENKGSGVYHRTIAMDELNALDSLFLGDNTPTHNKEKSFEQ